jgi:two-component system chemotaxis response regulator CheB
MNRLVVIGASAGGIDALRVILAPLPADFAAPICVVVHISAESPGVLHGILDRVTPLRVVSARNQTRLEAGHVYIAPPDFHLLVEPGRLRLTKGPRENRFRPAIDPLFRSAAQVAGPAAIGVVLTGNLDDGTAGLGAIKKLGGVAIVQDPLEARYPSMPQSALNHVEVDYCVPLERLPRVLVDLTRRPAARPVAPGADDRVNAEVGIAKEQHPMEAGLDRFSRPSLFTCPECHGTLLEIVDEGRVRYRCHTGHAFSADSLLSAAGDEIDAALWNAIRSLEESARFLDALATHVREAHPHVAGERFRIRAEEARAHSKTLRQIALARDPLVGEAASSVAPAPVEGR